MLVWQYIGHKNYRHVFFSYNNKALVIKGVVVIDKL